VLALVGVTAAATALAVSVGAGVAGSGAPTNTKAPSISGQARDGQTLDADRGTWSGTTPITYTYQWQRCDSAGGSCAAVTGATNDKYTLTTADIGSRLRVQVTATNTGGSANATSDATAVVVAAGNEPANKKEPTISGSAKEGQTLTAGNGQWTGTTPITYAYQWLRCDQAGNGCGPISGATKQTYVLVSADVGHRLRVEVKATNSGGSSTADSNATDVVGPASTTGAISIDAVSLPNRLVISRVSFQPNPVRSRGPISATIVVTDTSGRPVSGAVVFLRGVPERRIAPEPEVKTDERGVASFTLEPTRLLPLQAGARLTMFVRARKPGDSLIAGVSTRRLVSLRLSSPA
jgi:hypothetical protein